MEGGLLWAAALAAVAGVGALRWSWSGKRRSVLANALAWALLGLAGVLSGASAGAWGIAVASLFAMGAALVLLGMAAAQSPSGRGQALDRRVRMVPEAGEPLRLGRRLSTFVLVVLGGFAASLALAIALRAAGLMLGWSEADANAAALFAVPLAWGVLASVLLMQERRAAQFLTLAIASLPLLPVLMTGS